MTSGVGTLDSFPSIWGHWAGGPGDSVDDVRWLDRRLLQFFSLFEQEGRTRYNERAFGDLDIAKMEVK